LKKIIILLLAISLLGHANDSGIQINKVQGGANFGSGTINNNHFEAKLKIVQKNSYNQTVTYTKNITNILQQNPTLLRKIKSQLKGGFTSVTTLIKKHSSILGKILKLSNANSSRQKQIIVKQNQLIYGQKKLLDGQGKLLHGQGMLVNGQGQLLGNQEIIVDNQGKIYNTQGQILNNQAYLVDNQGRIMNGLGNLIGGQIKILDIVQDTNYISNQNYQATQKIQEDMNKVTAFIDEPDIKNARARMTGSCTRANYMQRINNTYFNSDVIGRFSDNIDSDKIRCIGELYKRSSKNFYINLKHADSTTARIFSKISRINMGNISYEGSISNNVIVTTTYK